MSASASGGEPSPRKEVGDAASSQKHPPHVSESAEDAPVQQSNAAPNQTPVLGANASGKDKVSTKELDQPIREGSMYDQRPAEDKDRPPSSPATP